MTGQLEIEIHFHFHIFDTCNLTLSSCAVGATWNSISFSLSHLSNLYFHFIFLCWRSYLKFTLPLLWPHFLIWTLILSFSASSSSLSSYLSPYHHHHICHPHNYCLLSLLTIHIIFRILIPCIVLAAIIISQVWWAHHSPISRFLNIWAVMRFTTFRLENPEILSCKRNPLVLWLCNEKSSKKAL